MKMKRRVEPQRLRSGESKTQIVLIDDVGLGLPTVLSVPWKGLSFQRVKSPPGKGRSSRKQSERQWR